MRVAGLTAAQRSAAVSSARASFSWPPFPWGGGGTPPPKISPVWKTVTISASTSPLTVPIVGAGGTAPAGTKISYLKVAMEAGVLAAASVNADTAIQLTLLNVDRTSSVIPIVVGYTVTDTTTNKTAVGTLAVYGPPNKKPVCTGCTPPALGPAVLGVPYPIAASTLLAGWSDPDGNTFGVTYGRVKTSGWGRGVVGITALTPGNWTAWSFQTKRVDELTYWCVVPDLKPSATLGGSPKAKKPGCLNGATTLEYAVTDARLGTSYGTATITVTQPTTFVAQLLGVGAVSRAWAAKFYGPILTNATISTSSIDWAGGVSAAVSSSNALSAGATLNVTADGGAASVVLTYTGATYYGFNLAIAKGSSMVTVVVTLSDGQVLTYPIVAPVALPKFKAYVGGALFGPATVATVEVKGSQMSSEAVIALSEFDVSTSAVAYPTWT